MTQANKSLKTTRITLVCFRFGFHKSGQSGFACSSTIVRVRRVASQFVFEICDDLFTALFTNDQVFVWTAARSPDVVSWPTTCGPDAIFTFSGWRRIVFDKLTRQTRHRSQ